MRWARWVFSAKLAWQQIGFRICSLLTLIACLGACTAFLVIILSHIPPSGLLVMHYNVYIGIDQIHPWIYVILLPLVWVALTVLDLILAYGSFRADRLLAWSFNILAIMMILPWSILFTYLVKLNL